MKLNLPLFLLSLLTFMSTFAYSQTQNTSATDSIAIRIEQVENSLGPLVKTEGQALFNLEAQMQKYNVSGLSIAVINNNKVEWAKGYGVANKEAKVSTETVFQAASMSKTVNAVALLKLAEQYNVDLDVDVNTLLASWKLPYNQSISSQPITLRQLLSHTAGLSTHGFDGYRDFKKLPTTIETLEATKPANSEKVQPAIAPNQEFKYSGGGITITQLILSDISNASYEQFVAEHVFQPLNMDESFYSIELDKYPKQIAHGHSKSGRPLKNNYNIYPESAAAGLWTTPTDLAKLLIDLQLSLTNQSGKVLSNRSSQEMITPPLENETSALGIFTENQAGDMYLQNSGVTTGFRSKLHFGTSNGKGVVVMLNGTNTVIIEQIIRSVAAVYNWSGYERLERSADINTSNLNVKPYLGTYAMGDRKVIVSLEEEKLIITEKGKWAFKLTPLTATSFAVANINSRATLDFILDDQGSVTKLIMVQGGTYVWKRIN